MAFPTSIQVTLLLSLFLLPTAHPQSSANACSNYFLTLPTRAKTSYSSSSPSPTNCICPEPFIWSPAHLSCLRLVSCRRVRWANDTGYGVESCRCFEEMIWNPYTMACQLNCQKWNARKHGNSCGCGQGEQWVAETGNGKEQVKVIGCMKLCHEGSKRDGSGRCECEERLKWDEKKGRCVVDCGRLGNSERVGSGCQCRKGYVFEDNNCVLNCSMLTNTSPTHLTGTPNSQFTLHCLHKNNTTGSSQYRKAVNSTCGRWSDWNEELKRCLVDCRKVPFTDLSDAEVEDRQGWCRCLRGYQWRGWGCVRSGVNDGKRRELVRERRFTLTRAESQRKYIEFQSDLNSLLTNLPLDTPYRWRLKSHLNNILSKLYNHLLFLSKQVPLSICNEWKQDYIWPLIQTLSKLHLQITRQLHGAGLFLLGNTNTISTSLPSSYTFLIGNRNTLIGPNHFAIGQYLSTSGSNNMIFGRDIQAITRDSIVVGGRRRVVVVFKRAVVLGEFQINLEEGSSHSRGIRVIENQRDLMVERNI